MILILVGIFTENVNGQISFTDVETKLQLENSNNELYCSGPSLSVKFSLNRDIEILELKNFLVIDSQVIQIMSLKYDGFSKNTAKKDILDRYSKYELEYFKNDIGLEVINPNNQWVITKSRGWYIWYFKVGENYSEFNIETKIQLFATTIIGDKILIINAPISAKDDFSKAALIVNDLMESLVIIKE